MTALVKRSFSGLVAALLGLSACVTGAAGDDNSGGLWSAASVGGAATAGAPSPGAAGSSSAFAPTVTGGSGPGTGGSGPGTGGGGSVGPGGSSAGNANGGSAGS